MNNAQENSAQSAAQVEPSSIELRSSCGSGAEVLVRHRPPGAVQLGGGQREHMLLCSVGHSEPGADSRSILRTEDIVQEWRRPPTGHVTFIPAGMPLEWEWNYRSDSVHLILPPSFVDGVRREVFEETGSEPSLRPLLRIANENIRHLMYQLGDEAKARGEGQGLAMSSMANLVALHALRAMNSTSQAAARPVSGLSGHELQRALDLLEDRLGEKVSLEELAAECGLSTFHFARAFKRAVGHPPHEYQLRRRVQRAGELLRSSPRRTVAEVASELGFSDESHMRRHFKRIVGTTPGQFRR